MTRHLIPGDGSLDIGANLHGPLGATMRRHAEARLIRADVLVGMIVEKALRDDIVDAILDDKNKSGRLKK